PLIQRLMQENRSASALRKRRPAHLNRPRQRGNYRENKKSLNVRRASRPSNVETSEKRHELSAMAGLQEEQKLCLVRLLLAELELSSAYQSVQLEKFDQKT